MTTRKNFSKKYLMTDKKIFSNIQHKISEKREQWGSECLNCCSLWVAGNALLVILVIAPLESRWQPLNEIFFAGFYTMKYFCNCVWSVIWGEIRDSDLCTLPQLMWWGEGSDTTDNTWRGPQIADFGLLNKYLIFPDVVLWACAYCAHNCKFLCKIYLFATLLFIRV